MQLDCVGNNIHLFLPEATGAEVTGAEVLLTQQRSFFEYQSLQRISLLSPTNLNSPLHLYLL